LDSTTSFVMSKAPDYSRIQAGRAAANATMGSAKESRTTGRGRGQGLGRGAGSFAQGTPIRIANTAFLRQLANQCTAGSSISPYSKLQNNMMSNNAMGDHDTKTSSPHASSQSIALKHTLKSANNAGEAAPQHNGNSRNESPVVNATPRQNKRRLVEIEFEGKHDSSDTQPRKAKRAKMEPIATQPVRVEPRVPAQMTTAATAGTTITLPTSSSKKRRAAVAGLPNECHMVSNPPLKKQRTSANVSKKVPVLGPLGDKPKSQFQCERGKYADVAQKRRPLSTALARLGGGHDDSDLVPTKHTVKANPDMSQDRQKEVDLSILSDQQRCFVQAVLEGRRNVFLTGLLPR
jgi:hypothetical protein